VIVKFWGVPAHSPYTGVTIMVATVFTMPLLIAEKAVMLPVPLAARPMLVLLLVHVNAVAVPVKLTAVVLIPLHTTWLGGNATVGVGCTVIVKACGVPGQVTAPKVYFGVMVIVAMTGEVPAFVAVKAVMFPVPLAASPIEAVLLVQS
jgi:hypothetical protein